MSFQLMLPALIGARQASQTSTRSVAEVQLSQQQSLCLVKIFLNASLGCICFARGLIPCDSPSYQDRRIDDLELILTHSAPASYHSFLSFQGQLSVNTKSQLFKVLVRGKDKRADHILDLVENGVFEAVDRGYVEAVQFSLSCGSSQMREVIECYTFSFSYTECEDSRPQVCSVKVSSTAADYFHITGVQKSFRQAIHNLLAICQQLPALPHRRSLGVSLLYNPTCPVLYEPSGFAGPHDTDIFSFIDTSTATDDVGEFHVGSYKIAVTAGRATPAEKEVADRSKAPENINDEDSHNDPTSSHIEDLTTRRQLQAMQRSSSAPSNLIPTQMGRAIKCTRSVSQSVCHSVHSAATSPKHNSGKEFDWSSLRKQNITPTKMAELIVQAWGLEAQNKSYLYILDMDDLRKNNKIRRLKHGEDVGCECGSDHEEDAMTFCELCGCWQHDICYGLQRFLPQNRPSEHFCYPCLLLPRAAGVNNEMPGMVRMRLALTLIHDYDVEVVGKDSLIKAAYITADDQLTYQELVAELQHQGFIRKTAKDGVFAVVKEEKVTDNRFKYLDPLARIEDYYIVAKDTETTHGRANAIQQALNRYTNGKTFDLGEDESELDKWLCENAFGRPIVRWGFYPERNKVPHQLEIRKRAPSPVGNPAGKKPRIGRKISISKTMINLDFPSDTSSETEPDDSSTTDNTSTA